MQKVLEISKNSVCATRMIETVRLICQHDRYQASHGIVDAACIVAGRLREETGIEPHLELVDEFPGRVWDFDLPPAWTPMTAFLEVPNCESWNLSQHPLLIATNSAPLQRISLEVKHYMPGEWSHGDHALALVQTQDFDLERIKRDGVRICATSAPSLPRAATSTTRGRIELPANETLTVFSLDQAQFAVMDRLAWTKGSVTAAVDVDQSAAMPLLSWVSPGELPGEIWVMAHLCHQRPGANDNASGVAGLVEISRCLSQMDSLFPGRQRATVRFFSGPEFTGIARYLHGMKSHWEGFQFGPKAVINLDMIGQDCTKSGGQFRIERGPGSYWSPLVAVAERATEEIFTERNADWAPMVFKGYSDNSLFAAGGFACPTVQFCHDSDSFNHSSEDRPEHLSRERLRDATAAALVTISIMASGGKAACTCRQQVFADWLAAERKRTALLAISWRAQGFNKWADIFEFDCRKRITAAAECLDKKKRDQAEDFFDGPLNLRGLLKYACAETRRAYFRQLPQNKELYSITLHALINWPKERDAAAAVTSASFALEKPFSEDVRKHVTKLVEEITQAFVV